MLELFSYGTLQDENVQKEIFGKTLVGVPGVLCGYKKIKINIDGNSFPLIVKSNENAEIKGTLYNISQSELIKVDDYEGPAYGRIRANLKNGREVLVYVAC